MPSQGPESEPTNTEDPLIRILAEMLESALAWEDEHDRDLTDPDPGLDCLTPTPRGPHGPEGANDEIT